jgi:hypothetical protein
MELVLDVRVGSVLVGNPHLLCALYGARKYCCNGGAFLSDSQPEYGAREGRVPGSFWWESRLVVDAS